MTVRFFEPAPTAATAPAPAPDGQAPAKGSSVRFFDTAAAPPPKPKPMRTRVEDDQRVTNAERGQINTLGLGPESIVNWLKDQGYESRLHKGEPIVRKVGEPTWGRVEPPGLLAGKGLGGKLKELGKDLSIDAANEYTSMYATGKGALLGAGAGSALPVAGTIAGGVGGGALGATLTEIARRAAAHKAGFKESFGEHAKGVGIEAALGAAGSLPLKPLAAAVKGTGRGLQMPARRAAADIAHTGALKDYSSARGSLLDEVLATERPAVEKLTQARAAQTAGKASTYGGTQDAALDTLAERAVKTGKTETYKRLKLQAQDQMEKLISEADNEAATLIAAGKARAQAESPVTFKKKVTEKVKTTAPADASGGGFDIPSWIASPDYGFTADSIKRKPTIGAALRRIWGNNFVPTFADGSKRGSWAMKPRHDNLTRQWNELSPQARAGKSREWTTESAALLLGDPELSAGLGKPAISALSAAATGNVTPTIAKQVSTILETSLTNLKSTTPELKAAGRELAESDIRLLGRTQALQEARHAAGEEMQPLNQEVLDRIAELAATKPRVSELETARRAASGAAEKTRFDLRDVNEDIKRNQLARFLKSFPELAREGGGLLGARQIGKGLGKMIEPLAPAAGRAALPTVPPAVRAYLERRKRRGSPQQ